LKEIDSKVEAIDKEIKKFCDELDIEAPILWDDSYGMCT
jgi:hypothetical protein